MAQTFNPEIIDKIFIALTYFRTWIVLFLFPVIIILPDIAISSISRIFFPSPSDIIYFNEKAFKDNIRQVKIQQIKDIIDPFPDEKQDMKINSNRSQKENLIKEIENKANNGGVSSNNNMTEKTKSKVFANKENSELGLIGTNNFPSYYQNRTTLNNNNTNHLTNGNNTNFNNYIHSNSKNIKKESDQRLNSKQDSKSFDSKIKSPLEFNLKSKRKNKKESIFDNLDFEMREGKRIIVNINILITFRKKTSKIYQS